MYGDARVPSKILPGLTQGQFAGWAVAGTIFLSLSAYGALLLVQRR